MTVHGDFSREVSERWTGVLFQQGRVLLDTDGTAQTLIAVDWRDTAARDIIGECVAAVPAATPTSFRVDNATLAGGVVTLSLQPGRVWADGLLVRAEGNAALQRVATYLQPPVQTPPGSVGSIAAGVRDAVILEVWREAVSGFQLPEALIEPALGGPDTTERLQTAFALRLFRLAADDTCENIRDRLGDNPGAKGRLTVTLDPDVVIPGDCPVVEGGGFSGFEHNLYRIEVAETGGGPVRFKWSQVNGGLTGRARFDAVAMRATITANLAAITSSGLTAFYLEALRLDPALGRWRVVYGADVTLDADNRFVLPAAPITGAIPGPIPGGEATVFIRLWNGQARVDAFPPAPPAANPTPLQDGIRLAFDPPGAGRTYTPGDAWTFPLRAGEIANPGPFPTNDPPAEIPYHRVPLAVITWNGAGQAQGTIEDCRRIVHPLTRLGTCCTYRVGDGVQSHGDFDTIQAAVDALPDGGGEVCVLPGRYEENVLIDQRRNVTVSGCGPRSLVVSAPPADGQGAPPVFHVLNSPSVRISGLAIEADDTGVGILLEDSVAELLGRGRDVGPSGILQHQRLIDLFVRAATRPAIEVRGGSDVTIRECLIEMRDAPTEWPAIFFQGEDALIERNVVRVRPRQFEAAERERLAARLGEWPRSIVGLLSEGDPIVAGAGLGGMQIGGLSERVRIVENVIQGGIGNGITLGSIRIVDDNDVDLGLRLGWVINRGDPCDPCRPGDVVIPDPDDGDGGRRPVPSGPLRDIIIERNRILDMGLNGIGVVGFFNFFVTGQFGRRIISVERIRIEANEIRRCLRRTLAPVRENFFDLAGYGGVALADVSYLTIRGNIIENNGPDYLEPICGVFVLHGEGIEIAHNRIVGNGAATAEPPTAARPGRRGGINVVLASAPLDEVVVDGEWRQRRPEGTPALRVHDNVVSVPLGQALAVNAYGPVSVQGNSFTSMGVVPRPDQTTLSLFGATVTINNLGRSTEDTDVVKHYASIAMGVQPSGPLVSENPELVLVDPNPRALPFYVRGIGSGFVLFTDNQCHFMPTRGQVQVDAAPPRINSEFGGATGLFTTATSFLSSARRMAASATLGAFAEAGGFLPIALGLRLASVSIFSLDDIGVNDNQCLTTLPEGTLLAQLVALGDSVRVNDNRFKEGPADAILSAITLGRINITMSNEATHCILVRPQNPMRAIGLLNIVRGIVDLPGRAQPCQQFDQFLPQFGIMRG